MDELTPRQKGILHSIVEDYFVHVRPIASHPLKKQHHLRFSAPTIRNEMMKLEELGYLAKRHTSSGRIPTEKAYRLYLDDLLAQAPQAYGPAVDRAIAHWNSIAAELQTLVMESLRMLSAQLETATFATLPFVENDRIEGVEIVPLGAGRVVVTLRLQSRWAESRVLLLPTGAPEFNWDEISDFISHRLDGLKVHQVTFHYLQKALQETRDRVVVATLLESFFSSLKREARLFLDGWQYLSDKPEFTEHPTTAKNLALVLNAHDVLLKVVDRALPADANPGVVWESELKPYGVEGCVIIRQAYDSGQTAGIVGVAGPMRMDYPLVLTLLNEYTAALARRFSMAAAGPSGDTR